MALNKLPVQTPETDDDPNNGNAREESLSGLAKACSHNSNAGDKSSDRKDPGSRGGRLDPLDNLLVRELLAMADII